MRCSKCKTKLKKVANFCPVCGAKVKKTFDKWRPSVLIVVGLICGAILVGLWFGMLKDGIPESTFAEVNKKCVSFEEGNITMQNEWEGIADIIVYIPDYEKLFKEAGGHPNAEQYLFDTLESGKYPEKEIEETARVTVKDGKRTVHSEEVVEQVLADALIEAVNSLSEVGE